MIKSFPIYVAYKFSDVRAFKPSCGWDHLDSFLLIRKKYYEVLYK